MPVLYQKKPHKTKRSGAYGKYGNGKEDVWDEGCRVIAMYAGEVSACCLFFGPPHENKSAIYTPLKKSHFFDVHGVHRQNAIFPERRILRSRSMRRPTAAGIFPLQKADAGVKHPHPPTLNRCGFS
jgi:hypothetical protein